MHVNTNCIYIYVITEKHYVAGIRGVKQPETHL